MYHVLLAVDDEDGGLAQARTITELPLDHEDVRATILHVFTENPSGASASQVKAVRSVSDHLEDAGIDVELREHGGDPATNILDVADDLDVDLITLAGRKRSPAGKMVFGSVTQSVLLGTQRAVLVCDMEKESTE